MYDELKTRVSTRSDGVLGKGFLPDALRDKDSDKMITGMHHRREPHPVRMPGWSRAKPGFCFLCSAAPLIPPACTTAASRTQCAHARSSCAELGLLSPIRPRPPDAHLDNSILNPSPLLCWHSLVLFGPSHVHQVAAW